MYQVCRISVSRKQPTWRIDFPHGLILVVVFCLAGIKARQIDSESRQRIAPEASTDQTSVLPPSSFNMTPTCETLDSMPITRNPKSKAPHTPKQAV